jgi:hypothetical protein
MLQPLITSVAAVAGHKIRVCFQTGEQGLFDVAPYIEGSWFGLLRDPDYFKTVHVTEGGKGIEWAGGQDIAPHELYDAVRERRGAPTGA